MARRHERYSEGEEPRREQDKYFANMPPQPIMKSFPDDEFGIFSEYNDNISGIDMDQGDISQKIAKNMVKGYP